MEVVQIKNGIYWVGVQDPDLKVFDVIMETVNGTSYNAYLVQGNNKTALVETKSQFFFGIR